MSQLQDDLVQKEVFISLVRWFTKLTEHPAILDKIMNDQYVFATYATLMIGFLGVPEEIKNRTSIFKKLDGRQFEEHEDFRKLFRDLQLQFGEEVTAQYAAAFASSLALHIEFDVNRSLQEKTLAFWRAQAESIASNRITTIDVNIGALGKLLGFNDAETKLLNFAMLVTEPTLQIFFRALTKSYSKRGDATAYIFAAMFQCPATDITAALDEKSTLSRSGLLTYDKISKRFSTISPWMAEVIAIVAKDTEELFRRFVKPMEPKQTPGALARVNDQDEVILKRVLGVFIGKDDTEDGGINVLCYGARSIDKESYLFKLVHDLGITPWVVTTKGVPNNDMPAVCYIAQRWMQHTAPYDVLIVPRAANVLTRGRSKTAWFLIDEGFKEEDDGKTRDHDEVMLLENPVKTIWMADRQNAISEENVGRFLFHCELRGGTRADRREEVANILKDFNLSSELMLELAKHKGLGREQLRSAARLADLIAADPDLPAAEVVKRAVERSQKALGRDEMEDLRESVTKYSLDYLNIRGKYQPEQIIQALKKRPHGTLCLWGLPGVGKTQLAEYIAVQLDMPIIMKRASDLLSKWLGENEQNISGMFDEAEEENAILFLDEADSFLRDRAMARYSWEVSSVNELLQRMERFKGIFICATNLFESIDAAALRRFTFKLEFKELSPEQRWKMFIGESGLIEESYDAKGIEHLQDALGMIRYLTPGDFATVKRQANLLGETLTIEDWLKQLGVESEAKLQGVKRNDYQRGGN